jgi:hypothetical protein
MHFACSYAANAQVFFGSPSFAYTFRDGSANTVMLAEHYAYRCGANNVNPDGFTFSWMMVHLESSAMREDPSRATFADGGILKINVNDVAPISQGVPPITRGMKKIPGRKAEFVVVPIAFQDRPTLKDCRPDLPQTPHHSMVTGYGDGSVRLTAPSITPAVFWSLTTPAGGEVVSN